MTPEARRARAISTKVLLDDANVQAAFDAMERDIMEEWGRSWWPPKQKRLWHDLRAIRRLRQTLAVFAGQYRE